MPGKLKVGYAKVDITPPLGIPMGGYWYERRAKGIYDNLYARAFVFDDGETRVALVSCDLLGLEREYTMRIRRFAHELTGMPEDNMLICSTHTHTGPQTLNTLTVNNPIDEDYMVLLERRVADAIFLAEERLRPAAVGAASGFEDHVAFNRRYKYSPSNTVIDPEVGVVRLDDPRGNIIGAIVNYSLHPCIVGDEHISADFPCHISETIWRAEGCESMFVNGACGNISHINYASDERQFGYDYSRKVGVTLAYEALKAMQWADTTENCRIRILKEEIQLPLRYPTEEEVEEAKRRLREGDVRESRDGVYAKELLILNEMRNIWGSHLRTEIYALALGDILFVTAPGELFVELGLEAKRRSSFRHTFIIELVNDYVGYIPTREAYSQGGYEVADKSRHVKLAPGAGELWVEAALKMIHRIVA